MRERSAILGISFYPGILKDRRERSASAVRERIRPALAIMSMNPRTAIDCIACARIPTVAWSMSGLLGPVH